MVVLRGERRVFAAFGAGCALVILACAAVVGGVALLGAYEFGYISSREVKAEGAPPDANIPEEGRLLVATDLRESWDFEGDAEEEHWWHDSDGRHIRVFGGDREWYMVSTDTADFDDVSASIRVRQVSTDPASIGCISTRVDSGHTEQYSLCLSGAGEVSAVYTVYAEKLQDWHGQTFIDWSPPPVAVASRDWNTLKIITHGNQLWFIVNDTYVGQAFHDGPVVGRVAFYVANASELDAEWLFDELIVRKAEAE